MSPRILSARALHSEGTELIVEYPYLDRSVWHTLTPELLRTSYPSLLLQVAVIADYLHLLGLVHGDLKLENFQITTGSGAPRVMLVDLDFLTETRTSAQARVFGTPGYIAPEVLENDVVTVQSDNYSLGASLKRFIESPPPEGRAAGNDQDPVIERLRRLGDGLTNRVPEARPGSVIDALGQFGIVDRGQLEGAHKTVLGMQLLTTFRAERAVLAKDRNAVHSFVTESNRLFGIPEEMLDDFYDAYLANKLAAVRLFGTLIQGAAVDRYGTFCRLTLPDRLIEEVFGSIDEITGRPQDAVPGESIITGGRLRENIESVLKLQQSGHYLRSFFLLKRLLGCLDRSADPEAKAEKRRVLEALGGAARTLGRAQDAREYLGGALSLTDTSSGAAIELIFDLVYLHLLAGDLKGGEELISKGLEISEKTGDDVSHLGLSRQHAWVLSAQGKSAEAELLLGNLLDQAEKGGWWGEVAKIHLVVGVLQWRKGDFPSSEKELLKALSLLQRENLESELIGALTNLTSLYYELAEYQKAVDYGNQAVRYAGDPDQATKLPSVYINLVSSYTRLGEYKEAEGWLQRYLAGKRFGYDRDFFRNYYLFLGNLLLNKGDLSGAIVALHQARQLYRDDEVDKGLGKLHHSLALAFAYRGNHQACVDHAARARAVFQRFSDHSSLAEIELVEVLNSLYGGRRESAAQLGAVLRRLLEHNCRYYAVLCLLHILLFSDDATRKSALAAARKLLPLIKKSPVPLFSAVALLIDTDHAFAAGDSDVLLRFKAAYRKLHASGLKFHAMLLSREIALRYLARSQGKLAGKFFLQASRLAESIGNRVLADSLKEAIRSSEQGVRVDKNLMGSVFAVSNILANVEDYELSLRKLVEYAVDATGAERGVLMLKSGPSGELQARSCVNCDDTSLKDIRDFSRTIPASVAEDSRPMIVDNALEDDRTKTWKSIIAHNILSVICVPVKVRDRLEGVLYLDHHTIPALFKEEDVTFIYSMGNFISIILSVIQGFRDKEHTGMQMAEDLVKLGAKQPFCTQNATMKKLLSKFPEVAQSNASVLIQGESGTGKEILGRMLHELSARTNGPLVKLNCAAIPSSLIESELFGIAKNTASGVAEREGKFSAADGGTLFLDEIGDMSLEIQAKVLRVLEYQEFEKVGSNRTIFTDVRFIYATNKDIQALVEESKFRQDLYYRINTFTIIVPPLRERPDDIPVLAEHFSGLFTSHGKRPPIFSQEAMAALMAYRWPGNVRELRNLVERFCITCAGKRVGIIDLPREMQDNPALVTRDDATSHAIEKARIRELLILYNWNQSKVAREMKMPLSTLRRRIKKYGLSRDS